MDETPRPAATNGNARVSAEWRGQLLQHALEHASEGLAHIEEAAAALHAALSSSGVPADTEGPRSLGSEHGALMQIGDVELVDGDDGLELRPATPAR